MTPFQRPRHFHALPACAGPMLLPKAEPQSWAAVVRDAQVKVD